MLTRIAAFLGGVVGLLTLAWQIGVIGYHFGSASVAVKITIVVIVALFTLFLMMFTFEVARHLAAKLRSWLRRGR